MICCTEQTSVAAYAQASDATFNAQKSSPRAAFYLGFSLALKAFYFFPVEP
jgi:hypothetical protein